MMQWLVKIAVNAVALWVAALAISGIHLGEEASSLSTRLVTIALVALLFGVVNWLLKPLAMILSFPAILLTLGLFTWVVNAFMLQITSWLAGPLGLDFHVDRFFWDALLGSLVITFVAMLLHLLLPDPKN